MFFCFLQSLWTKNLYAKPLDDLNSFVGNHDAILVVNPQGRIVFSKNADNQLVPASVLKIFTALVALHYLGPEYRFSTEFYQNQDSTLKIKGYGDPLLISEILMEIVNNLILYLETKPTIINDLVLDDSYFKSPVLIPGVASSYEPYDAPNGALCVNFNTVNFRRDKNGAYVSGETQTPLLPFVLSRITASAMDRGRIILSRQKNEKTLYAGHLFLYFLKKQGIKSNGKIRMGRVEKCDKLIFRYLSRFSLIQVLSTLLEYSNNFIANQLLIASGAKAYGPPGTLEKGIRAASTTQKTISKSIMSPLWRVPEYPEAIGSRQKTFTRFLTCLNRTIFLCAGGTTHFIRPGPLRASIPWPAILKMLKENCIVLWCC